MSDSTINKLLVSALSADNDGEALAAIRVLAKKVKAGGNSVTSATISFGSTENKLSALAAMQDRQDLIIANRRLSDLERRIEATLTRPSTRDITKAILAAMKEAGKEGVTMDHLSTIKGFDTRLTGAIIASGGGFWVGKCGDKNRRLVQERYRFEYPEIEPRGRSTAMQIAEQIRAYGEEGVSRKTLNADSRRLSDLLAVETVIEVGGILYHADFAKSVA